MKGNKFVYTYSICNFPIEDHISTKSKYGDLKFFLFNGNNKRGFLAFREDTFSIVNFVRRRYNPAKN